MKHWFWGKKVKLYEKSNFMESPTFHFISSFFILFPLFKKPLSELNSFFYEMNVYHDKIVWNVKWIINHRTLYWWWKPYMKIISVSLPWHCRTLCDTSQTFQCFSPGQANHLSLIILIHRQVDQGCHIVENHILHGEKSAHSSHPPYNSHKESSFSFFSFHFFSFHFFHFISLLHVSQWFINMIRTWSHIHLIMKHWFCGKKS